MIALFALIAFVIALVKLGTVDAWQFWALLGLALIALEMVLARFGVGYPTVSVRRRA